MELKRSSPNMKTNRILRVHRAAAGILQHPVIGDTLIDFLVDLERDPGRKGRSLIFDNGFRRVESSQIADICIGYDLSFRIPLVYPALWPDGCREILVWEIAPERCFERRVLRRARRIPILGLLRH